MYFIIINVKIENLLKRFNCFEFLIWLEKYWSFDFIQIIRVKNSNFFGKIIEIDFQDPHEEYTIKDSENYHQNLAIIVRWYYCINLGHYFNFDYIIFPIILRLDAMLDWYTKYIFPIYILHHLSFESQESFNIHNFN